MPSMKILLTGATGYIGGSVLAQLLASNNPGLKNATITCVVRGKDRIEKLNQAYGPRVEVKLYRDLDDIDTTIAIAKEHDAVINTTLGFHPESAAALVKGLALRKKATGKDVFMIHTSGTSNLADQPITRKYLEADINRVFNDANDDIYEYEMKRNEQQPYGQRTSELGVVAASIEEGVKTIVIMSPTIYGKGTGIFNQSSIQVPAYAHTTLTTGHGIVVEEGKGVWDNVHMQDLAELYELVLVNMLEKNGADLPFGKKGIIFSGTARHTWKELAQGIADAAHGAGKISSPEVKSVSLEEGAKLFPHGDPLRVELGLSSNSKTEAAVAKSLGWKPSKGAEAWKQGFKEEIDAAIQKGSEALYASERQKH